MASYRKRGGVWHIQIRRQGYPALTKTFNAKTDADRWVRGVERGLDLGHFSFNNDTPKATYLCDLLARYRDNVSINKRGFKWLVQQVDQFQRISDWEFLCQDIFGNGCSIYP